MSLCTGADQSRGSGGLGDAGKVRYTPLSAQQRFTALQSGEVDVLSRNTTWTLTRDASGLASIRAVDAPNPDDYVILPEILSKEPLGPVVRRGDEQWFTIVKWVVYATLEAEEKGVTSANVDDMKANSTDPVVQRLLGTAGEMGSLLGLDNDWAYRVIKSVGNYGEIFDRNVGPNTPLRLVRGLNALWTDGGLMYAMPAR